MGNYTNLVNVFALNEEELNLLLLNLSDAFAFNEYLFIERYDCDFRYNLNSFESLMMYKKILQGNGLDEKTSKLIVISSPMLLLYNPFSSLKIVKNDEKVLGVAIMDDNQVWHYYRINRNFRRSITETKLFLNKTEDGLQKVRKIEQK